MSSAKIILAGNPNVGKSTIFNALTGLKQHTGNWSGKTVDLASGKFKFADKVYEVYDLPGTYSVISDSPEEKIARDYICFGNADLTVIVADATCLERNLNLTLQILEMTDRVLLCVNLADEAKRNGIYVDTALLEETLGIPVVSICGKKSYDIKRLKSAIADTASSHINCRCILRAEYPSCIQTAVSIISESLYALNISPSRRYFIALKLLDNQDLGEQLVSSYNLSDTDKTSIINKTAIAKKYLEDNNVYPIQVRDFIVETLVKTAVEVAEKCLSKTSSPIDSRTIKIDKLLTSKWLGIPITILFFGIILWITIIGANYPSRLLSSLFASIKPILQYILTELNISSFWMGLLIDGVYGTSSWVTAVMLPPMAIFFPLFTLLEDLGCLPRIAFNLDKCFKCANTSGKQSLTMCKEKFKIFLQHSL